MMQKLNRQAMDIPIDKLADALEERIKYKNEVLEDRNKKYGSDRIIIGSYMENLALPELFNFDMNDFYQNPLLAMEICLKSKIFWLDNSNDDWNFGLDICDFAGVVFDMTLFGQKIKHTPGGIPNFTPHPISQVPDLSLLQPLDFYKTGDMPGIIRQYESLNEISQQLYGGKIKVNFPTFKRGPLDIYIQMRGYENFIDDTIEEPEFVREFLDFIVNERVRWNKAKAEYLGEKFPPDNSFIADDWINFPFITPTMFEEFVVPAYNKINDLEGEISGFHTCGVMVPIAKRMLELYPHIRMLDVSGWNDYAELDRLVDDKSIFFSLNFINSFVLTASEEEHRAKFKIISEIAKKRFVIPCAQAMIRVHDTFDETVEHMNRFIDIFHEDYSKKLV